MLLSLWSIVACVSTSTTLNPPTDDPSDTGLPCVTCTETVGTGTTPPGASATVVSATCTSQQNVLRFDCAVQTDVPGPVRVRVDGPLGTVATFGSDERVNDHLVSLWGLTEETTYTFAAYGLDTPDTLLSGTVTTGSLPELVDVEMVIEGTASEAVPEYFLFDWRCGPLGSPEAMIIVNRAGQVVWYLVPSDVDPSEDSFRGYSLTPQGTLLTLLERKRLLEWDFAGRTLVDLKVDDGELANPVHHDVQRVGDYTYVLTSRGVDYPDGNRYAMDGFDVYGPDWELVASWSTEGVLDPTLVDPVGSYWGQILGVGAGDWAHANSVSIDNNLNVVVSLRYINMVLKIVGDPNDPAFGTVLWSAQGGNTEEPYLGTMNLLSSTGVAPVSWGDQHHVTFLPNGHLLMWDNRSDPAEASRALELVVDEVASTIDLVKEWEGDQWCPGAGSAYLLDNGNVFVDCSEDPARAMEIAPDQNILWSAHPSCPNPDYPTDHLLYRAVPVPNLYPSF